MKVGVWYDTVEETLFNAGLPPNRPGPQGLPRLRDRRQAAKVGGGGTRPGQHPVEHPGADGHRPATDGLGIR